MSAAGRMGGTDGAGGAGDEPLRLGGMALGNGLLVHGPTSWAVAVRTRAGELKVASGRKPSLASEATDRIPGLRGIAKLAEAVAVIPLAKRALPEARLPMQDARTVAAIAASAAASRVLRAGGRRTVGREAAVAAVGLAPALLALRSGDLASWHGVEHKSIAAYEQGTDAAGAAKEHERCGSHLVAPLLAGTVAGNVAVRRAGMRGPLAEGTVALASLAGAIELFAWCERHPDSSLTAAVRAPGFAIQRLLGTREPDAGQLEAGHAALDAVLEAEREAESGARAGQREAG